MQKPTRFSEMQKSLAQRWKPEWSADHALAPMAGSFNKAMASVAALMAKKEDLRASGKYSEQGLRDEVRTIARRDAVPVLRKAALAIERAEEGMKTAKAALTLQKLDPANVTEAVLRSEMRTWLRSLPQTQAVQALLSEGVDDRLVQAALEAPPVMSGLNNQMRDMVEKATLERKFGPELAALNGKSEAITVANSAVEVALYQFREEIEFTAGGAFDSWMAEATAQIERSETAPAPEAPTDIGSDFITQAFDEAFARALPSLYPDHPVNRQTA